MVSWTKDALDQTSKVVHAYHKGYDLVPRNLKTILEIGVDAGGSMKCWTRLFPLAEIYGVDITLNGAGSDIRENPRIHLIETDAYGGWVPAGLTFDLIIDDALHTSTNQIALKRKLWPFVNAGGFYIIEDIFQPEEIQAAFPDSIVFRTGDKADSVLCLELRT